MARNMKTTAAQTIERDAAIGEILRRLADDTTGLAAAVERGLDEQLAELNVPGIGEVDRLRGCGANRAMADIWHDAILGRVARKLAFVGADYIQQSLDLVRSEMAEVAR